MYGSLYPGIQLLMGTGAVFVLWLGGRMVIAGTITLGEFVAFGAYLAMLHWPMIALGWVVNLFERGEASMGRLLEILDAQPAIARRRRCARTSRRCAGDVEFRGLTFAYERRGRCCTTSTSTFPRGQHGRHRGPHRLRQEHAGEPAAAALRPAAGNGLRGRRRRPHRCPSATLREARRLRAAGDVPVLGDRARERRVRPARRRRRAARVEWAAGVAQLAKDVADFPQRLRHPRRRARASRCPAGRSSARRSRARWPSTPRSWSSTTRSPRSTPTPRRRSCAACAA